ncbi:MAG: hypothetical protein KatS3mg114_1294 [Planctomycetaceae bacterium]|nr:MAG: hypothetical protein KatS3mg114_1294 [Planctomycetaceae bacterium]
MKIASTSRMRAGFARMLVITKLLSLMSAAEVWAQNDSGEEVGTLVARWTFEDETLAGVKLEREEGPRPPWYPGFATKNQAWRVADQGVIIREHDLPGVNLRFGQGEAFTLEAWVRLEELADGQYAYVIGKGRSRRAGYPEQNQNYSLRLWGQKGMAHLSLLFASLADGGHRQWHRWNSISGFLLDGRWHHVAASYRFGDPESVRGWIDGQRVQGRWDLGGPTTHPPVVDDDVLILGSGNGGGSGNTLRGSVDEVAIWRGVLPDSVLASRYQYLPPPPPIVRDEVPAGRVLIQLCETGMPSRNAWPTEPPAATESYFEEVFGLFEVPHKYIDTGVRADRQHPYVLRAAAWVTLPEGEHRWLLRGRGASRLYVDDTLVLTLPFPPTDASGHGQVSAQREYLDLGPTFRLAPPGNREAWTTLYSPGRPQWVVLETIVRQLCRETAPSTGARGDRCRRLIRGERCLVVAEPR